MPEITHVGDEENPMLIHKDKPSVDPLCPPMTDEERRQIGESVTFKKDNPIIRLKEKYDSLPIKPHLEIEVDHQNPLHITKVEVGIEGTF